MDSKQQFGGFRAFYAYLVEFSELPDPARRTVYLVATDLAEEDFPLAEKGLRLRVVSGVGNIKIAAINSEIKTLRKIRPTF